MEIKDFYSFESKLLASTVQVSATGINDLHFKDSLEPHWHLIKGDFENFKFPILFVQKYGKNLCDIIDTGWPSLYLVSSRIKNTLDDHNLTGYKFFAVKVFDKKGEEILGYYGLSITGKCGKIDYSKSEIIHKEANGSRRAHKVYKGLHIGVKNWDNTDFSLPEGTFHIIISAKAANILKKERFSNLVIENLTEIEIDELSLPIDFGNENYRNN